MAGRDGARVKGEGQREDGGRGREGGGREEKAGDCEEGGEEGGYRAALHDITGSHVVCR